MRIIFAGWVLLTVACAGPRVQPGSGEDLRVMTFNIRYGTADDGDHSWPFRRHLVAGVIERHAPDVLAIQEGLAFQLRELGEALEGYRKLGQHRDGGLEGEFSGLYINERRIRVLEWGEFWLSPDSDSVASVGWDAALPRMAVWAEIETRAGGGRLRVYSTHFDHRGEEARLESARLIVRHAQSGPPSMVMGDLNADESSEPFRAFVLGGYRSAFTELHPSRENGTFNGFTDPTGGRRIDHILLGQGVMALEAEIVSDRIEGLFPSDHFPVVARIALGRSEPVPHGLR
jgi:endonuclease/exonuclease/phosphatase family metal-dependent hydrolase